MTTYITKTTGSSMTNQKKFTYSAWLKLANLELYQRAAQVYIDGNNRAYILYCFNDDGANNTFFFYDKEGGTINYQANTTAKFRDTNAWYHVVYKVDSTQASQADRVKIYINGEQQSMSVAHNMNQNVNTGFNSANANLRISGTATASETWKGLMSHVHFTDGYAYDASTFGETDSTTGEWKIKVNPSVTYGNNGFFLKMEDSSNMDLDSSGNNLTFTTSGSLTKTEDNPSNVFSTLDPLNVPTSNAPTFSNGNTKVVTSTGGNFGGSSNLGASSGKYYFEIKFTAESSSNMGNISLSSSSNARESARTNQHSNQVGASFPNLCYEYDGNVYKDSGGSQGSFGTYGTGDIIMIAMDLDNQKAYFGKNGTWGNSGDPTSGSTGTGAATLSANSDFWHLALGDRNSSATATYEVNFGNGYFGSTQISSAGTNASGIGIFEYDVPTGYTALSTKGLNT